MLHSGVHPLRPRGLGHYFIDSVPSPFVVMILFVLASVAVSRATRRRWRYVEDSNDEGASLLLRAVVASVVFSFVIYTFEYQIIGADGKNTINIRMVRTLIEFFLVSLGIQIK